MNRPYEIYSVTEAGPSIPSSVDERLLETRRAFDSVAAEYDGPTGNNALVQRMREALWRTVIETCPKGARLLDLGCGTGIDAVHLASYGYDLMATDWSPQMIARTCARASEAGFGDRIRAAVIGLQQMEQLDGQRFDAIYSNLGPLNCAPDLRAVARGCATLLKSQGVLIASVIGRTCPWEFAYYAVKGDWSRARLRASTEMVPVNLNHQTVWTRYYSPHSFLRAFTDDFELVKYRSLALFMPPPYLIRLYQSHTRLFAPLGWADEHLGALPGLREAGDHFLMVLKKRG